MGLTFGVHAFQDTGEKRLALGSMIQSMSKDFYNHNQPERHDEYTQNAVVDLKVGFTTTTQ